MEAYMGKLFDDIKKEQGQKGNRSRIAEILDALPEDERKDFLKALDDHGIPASNISKALDKRGHKLAINVISRYRRGELATKIK
jgi:DNA-binding transcriptional ArsR family regulator